MLNTVKITPARATGSSHPIQCSLHDFIQANADAPEVLLELCSKGMVVVGGGSAQMFHVELAR